MNLPDLRQLTDNALIRDYIFHPDRSNLLVGAIASLDDESQAVRLVELAFPQNPKLAAKLAGAVRESIEAFVSQRFRELLAQKAWRNPYYIHQQSDLLAETLAIWAISDLALLLPNEPYRVALALTHIANQSSHPQAKTAASEVLIRYLQDPNPRVQSIVMKQLGTLRSDRAVEPLLLILQDSDWVKRKDAAAALGEIGDRRAMNGLIVAASEDPHPSVRCNAIEALGAFNTIETIELAIAKLQDPDSSVSSSSARALGKLKSEIALTSLISALQNPNVLVKYPIVEALGELADDRAVEPLILMLQDDDLGIRARAITLLGKIGGNRAISALKQILLIPNYNSWLRQETLIALDKIGCPLTVEDVKLVLEDSYPQLRKLAAKTLLKSFDRGQGQEYLLEALQHPLSEIRVAAAKILGEMPVDILATLGIDRVVDALSILLEARAVRERKIAIIALGQIGSDRAIELLIAVFQNLDEYRRLRRDAIFALRQIGTEKVLEPLTLALRDPIPCVRIAAIWGLYNIANERAIDILINSISDALRDPSWRYRRSMYTTADMMVRIGGEKVERELLIALARQDNSRSTLRLLIPLLPQIGSQRSSDKLILLLEHVHKSIRRMAAFAIGEMPRYASMTDYIAKTIDPLIFTLHNSKHSVRWAVVNTLGLLANTPQCADRLEAIVSALSIAINDRNNDVRRRAITALAKIDSEMTFDILMDTIAHQDPLVAQQAVEGIGRMLHARITCKFPKISLTEAQIESAIERLKIASNSPHWQVSKAAREISIELKL